MKRRNRELTSTLRAAIGTCPACERRGAVVYRRSPTSVTMRCNGCRLQWTVTMHQLRRFLKRELESKGDA